MNPSSNTEQQFNSLLKSKDESALSFLFDNYGAAINGIVKRIFLEPAISDSVFKNTFLHICKNIHQYNQSKSSLFTWLISQTKSSVKENVIQLGNDSGKLISNQNIIDLSHAYTKEEIVIALDVPVNVIDSLALSAVSKIRYNKGLKMTIGRDYPFSQATG